MIGKNIKFRIPKYFIGMFGDFCESFEIVKGEVLDKIEKSYSKRDNSFSKHHQDLVLTNVKIYYLVADESGKIYEVKPGDICELIKN